jgi:hypothetical protein
MIVDHVEEDNHNIEDHNIEDNIVDVENMIMIDYNKSQVVCNSEKVVVVVAAAATVTALLSS